MTSDAVIYLIATLLVYFLPAIAGHKKKNAQAIFILNLFLGWTVLGWIIALIWASTKDK